MQYKIDGATMPAPTEFSFESNDLYGSNTGRDEAGVNHLDLIRSGIRKWKIKHQMLTRAEVDKIKKALNPLGFDFTGMHTDGIVTCNCYGTISSMTCAWYEDDTPDGSRWNLEFSVIEN